MPPIVKDLFLSKKFVVALLTAIGSIAAYKGWNVDPMTILTFATPLFVYIGAQGWADSGKEKAKIDGATAIQIHTMAMQNGAVTRVTSPSQDDQKPAVTVVTKSQEAGFARIHVMLCAAIFGAFLSLAVFAPFGGCAHPGQVTLRAGQCLLDDGVLSEVLAALGKPDYLKQVGLVTLSHASDLVDCALQAVAAQPAAGAGSGSTASQAQALTSAPPADTLASRAREVLAARRASGQ